ncbi:UNVERIFIED_CONTAM: hypothetical protein K2H54_038712 [Gekko kuhli]
MPPLVECCLLAAAALPLLFGASASPILDSSGEEQFSEDPSSRTSPARDLQLASCKYLAIMLRRKAFTWKEEERCLRGISDGLYAYQAFLEYIEETFISKEQETAFIWTHTKHLANTLKSMMNTPDIVNTPNPAIKEALSTQLRVHTGWNRKVIHYLILQNYISFMEKTVRAIRAVRGWETENLTSGA